LFTYFKDQETFPISSKGYWSCYLYHCQTQYYLLGYTSFIHTNMHNQSNVHSVLEGFQQLYIVYWRITNNSLSDPDIIIQKQRNKKAQLFSQPDTILPI